MAWDFTWDATYESLPFTSDPGGVRARAWKTAPELRDLKLGVRERQCILRKQDGTQWDTVGQYVAMVSSEDQVAPAHDAVAESLVSVDFNSTQAADWLFTATLNAHWVSTDDNFLDCRFKIGGAYTAETFKFWFIEAGGNHRYLTASYQHIEEALAAGDHTLELFKTNLSDTNLTTCNLDYIVLSVQPILVGTVT